jgi:hypothetical protein
VIDYGKADEIREEANETMAQGVIIPIYGDKCKYRNGSIDDCYSPSNE